MSNICRKRADNGSAEKGLKVRKCYTQSLLDNGHLPRTRALNVTVVCSGAYDESRSVLVHSDQKGYLFNVGEGTQAQSFGCACVQDILLTYNQWENMGCLYGVMLRMGRGIKDIRIHGPPNVEQILQMTKYFGDIPTAIANTKKMDIDSGSFSDWQMDIEYVKLLRSKSRDIDNKSSEAEGSRTEIFAMKRLEEGKQAEDFAVAYILRVNEKTFRGKIDKEKISKLKIQRSWISALHEKGTATTADGTVVKKEELFGEVMPHHPVVILECPHIDFLPSLTSSDQLLKLSCEEKDEPCLIVHMSPSHIVEMPEYQEFMNRFKNSNHLMLNGNSKPHIRQRLTNFHLFLNHLHPGIFPDILSHRTHAEPSAPQTGRVIQGETGLRYNWFDESGFDWSGCQVVNKESVIRKLYDENVSAQEIMRKWRETLDSLPKPKDKRPYPEIVFLGTGSASPSDTRNVTGILLHLSPEKCMLLDCGDGTCEQIRSFYGDKADDVFRKLTAVFISHLHCDHHLGLFSILNARRKALQKLDLPMTRLNILAPIQIQRWFFLYCKLIMNFLDEIQLVRHLYLQPMGNEHIAFHKSVLESLDLEEFNSIGVNHVPYSYGVSMKHKDGWKLVYSGDTMPSQRLVSGGKDCDLLIHEATFCDFLEYEALSKNHSTTSQAIQVAREMKAKFTILTHFSQRYRQIPVFTDKFTDDIGFSFDLMKVTLDDLHVIPHLKRVLEPFLGKYEYMKKRRIMDKSKNKDIARMDVDIYDQTIPKRSRLDKTGKNIARPARETVSEKTGIQRRLDGKQRRQ